MRLIMYVFSTFMSCILAGMPAHADANALPSAKARAAYVRALAALEDLYVPDGPKTIRQAYPEFVLELGHIVDALGDESAEKVAKTEGHSLAGKFVAIALDRRRRPEL